jgi:hypothetical protein
MTDTRDVGDGYPIRYEARDPDTYALTDATVALTITDPAGATTTPTPVHTGTGLYDYTISLSTAGTWFWRWDVSGTIADRAYGSVLSADPAPPTYASLQDVKDFLKITDTNDDAELMRRLVSGTRRVNGDCGRRFWTGTALESRTYRASHPELLIVSDIASTEDMVVEVGRGSSWTTISLDDIDFLPENAETDLRAIEVLQRVVGVWPVYGSSRVRVTARPGWPGVPEDIVMANCIQAARLFRRKDAIEGVLGNSDFGPIRVAKYDADYDNLIHPYVRPRP